MRSCGHPAKPADLRRSRLAGSRGGRLRRLGRPPVVKIDERAVAKAIAAGRIALGASYSLAPGLALRLWPASGSHADPASRFLARSTGVRDLAIGVGTFLALQKDAPVRGWLEAGMLADAGDALAVVLGARSLPRGRALMALTAATGTVVVARRLVGALEP